MKKLLANYKKYIALTLLVFAGSIILGLFGFISAIRLGVFGKLPSEKQLENIQNHEASRVFSYDGVLLGTYFQQNRSNVSFDEIPQHVIDALIATEDARFMQHTGVDYYAMTRVLVKSLLMGNSSSGGGSTISQQLVKNLYGRTFRYGVLSMPINKIKEMTTASRIEEIYSKNEILAMYLNTVSFGENVFGIENAALRYFNKNCSKLTLPEAAVIIGILKANTFYNPKVNPDNSLNRRNTVLSQMNKYGYLTDEELKELQAKPLGLNYKSSSEYLKENGYFLQHIKNQAEEIVHTYNEENDTELNIYTDGLKIETTLDKQFQDIMLQAQINHTKNLQPKLEYELRRAGFWKENKYILTNFQKNKAISEEEFKTHKNRLLPYFAEDSVMSLSVRDSLIYALSRLQSSVLAADPHTGAIRVWIGGMNYQLQPYDRVKSKRQVGSTFKPIVYYTALKKGLNPCKFIKNTLRTYPRYNDWSPQNSDGNHTGFYSVKGALANSVNTVTAEVLFKAGIKRVIETAQEMGIDSELPEVPSIALGTASISLQEMVQAYCSFANLGYKQNLYAIASIKTKDGKTIYKHEQPEPDQILDRTSVEEIITMMQAVVDEGTAKRIRLTYGIKAPIAGKTGTTQNNTDGWFMGYTHNLVMGIWMGMDNPAIHFQTTRNGQGANTALPIWAKGFKKIENSSRAEEYISDFPFDYPEYMNCEMYRETRPGIFENVFSTTRSTIKEELKKSGRRLFGKRKQ